MHADQKELMFSLFAKGGKYQRLIESAERHLKKFGLKRFFLFRRFRKINERLERYKALRQTYVFAALSISRKLNALRREERKLRKKLDH